MAVERRLHAFLVEVSSVSPPCERTTRADNTDASAGAVGGAAAALFRLGIEHRTAILCHLGATLGFDHLQLTGLTKKILLDPPQMVLRYGAIPTGTEPMVTCGMFTPSYGELARRLVDSLSRFTLPYAIFEVPTVHRSISSRGSDDPAYTKANFIYHALIRAGRPVLYLDVDCVVRSHPELVACVQRRGHDFAIFNWLAQAQNDAYIPYRPADSVAGAAPRYYTHAFHIDWASDEQLLCSGAVQFWADTAASRALLQAWCSTVVAQPVVSDDECLDFAFNNPDGSWRSQLRPFWLPKSYARCPWWIFDEPVIDHPDIPRQASDPPRISDARGRRRVYPERMSSRATVPFIPRDCFIDAVTGEVRELRDGQPGPQRARWPQKLWIPS